jgi:FkbM family methyltransferase
MNALTRPNTVPLQPPTAKTIEVMGWPAEIFGYNDDPYFERVNVYAAQNSILITEAIKVRPGAVIMDIGANIGVTAVIAHRAAASRLYIAVEPSPKAFACLTKTGAANAIEGFTPIQCALGAEPGVIGLRERDYLAGSFLDEDAPLLVSRSTVDIVVGDLGLDALDLIKIDVEGLEMDVLAGAAETLKRFTPTVVMEFSSYTLSTIGNVSPMGAAMHLIDMAGEFFTQRGEHLIRVHDRDTARQFILSNMELVTEDVWFRPVAR